MMSKEKQIMPLNQTLIDDMMTLCGNVLGGLADTRHELRAQAREHAEGIAKRLDLVGRDEFEAALAMLTKARAAQEDIGARLTALETKLKLSSTSARSKAMKANLPSVKKDHRRKRRA
jgi:BMFP domain-containing protein YqiC